MCPTKVFKIRCLKNLRVKGDHQFDISKLLGAYLMPIFQIYWKKNLVKEMSICSLDHTKVSKETTSHSQSGGLVVLFNFLLIQFFISYIHWFFNKLLYASFPFLLNLFGIFDSMLHVWVYISFSDLCRAMNVWQRLWPNNQKLNIINTITTKLNKFNPNHHCERGKNTTHQRESDNNDNNRKWKKTYQSQ